MDFEYSERCQDCFFNAKIVDLDLKLASNDFDVGRVREKTLYITLLLLLAYKMFEMCTYEAI